MPKLEVVNANNVIEFNPQKANFKLKNTGGPKGDTGAQGPQGPKGDTGAQGPAGASASVTVGSTTTLSPGADATVTNSGDTRNAILNFGIPTGARGPKGDTGAQGDIGPMGPKGAKGDTGAAATVQVGNTNTGAPGTNAQVTNAGNEHFAVFNFTIPRGDKGEKGDTGAQGHKGDKGDKGDAGTAATITVGSTTTTNPGTNATVTNSGTTSAAVLNFGIPKGATGSVKSEVIAELPETGEEDTFYLVNREATEQTATGKAINFTNSDNAGDITDFKLDGETSQNGTPTPSAPVAVQTVTGENVVKINGKNLLKLAPQASTSNGITATLTDGIIKYSGTASSNWANIAARTYNSIPAGTYMLSMQETFATNYAYAISVTYTDNTTATFECWQSVGNKRTVTLAKDVASYYVYLTGLASGTSYSGTISLMLEAGSTASSFEPYQGQSYEVNLGKNLFDASQDTTDYFINRSGAEVANTSWDISGYIPVVAGQAYSYHGLTNIGNAPYSAFYDASKTFVSSFKQAVGNNTITIPSGVAYVRFTIYHNDLDGVDNNQTFQLEKGSQATSYAAYFTPIELCKIGTYQDYIYKSGGKWYVHKAVGKYRLESAKVQSAYAGRYRYSKTDIPNSYIPSGTLNFKMLHFTVYANGAGGIGSVYAGGTMINLKFDENGDNISGFRDWVANSDVSLYYPLATPTDTEITNEALVAQLDNVASAPLYTGVNNITTITPNEQGTLEIKYVTYDKYNQNKVYIWNDTLQQWQIIVP